jgi:hypothetical protein
MSPQSDAEIMLDLLVSGYVKYNRDTEEWSYGSSNLSIYRCLTWQELVTRMKRHGVWVG